MPEIGPEHPLTYRQEIASPLFDKIHARESAAVVGISSMGKTRLLQFLLRSDVRDHYLREASSDLLLVWVDGNRLTEQSDWGLYELILTTLVEGIGEHPEARKRRGELENLRHSVIVEKDALLAQRYLEMALRILCREEALNVCLLLDEFDACYRMLPAQPLLHLRALRDANKYQLSYVLFLRDLPEILRPQRDVEGFDELISRSILGLQPYSVEDATLILQQIQARRGHELPDLAGDAGQMLVQLSGGHPGLLVALVDGWTRSQPMGMNWEDWAERRTSAPEECRKIWEGLRKDERTVLHFLANGSEIEDEDMYSLRLKGIVDAGAQPDFFSSLFARHAASQSPEGDLYLNVKSGAVWANGRKAPALTAKENDLFRYLYEHAGALCDTEDIIDALYPDEQKYEITNNNIARLVRRLREKIEIDPGQPCFLQTVTGRGYQLITDPAAAVQEGLSKSWSLSAE